MSVCLWTLYQCIDKVSKITFCVFYKHTESIAIAADWCRWETRNRRSQNHSVAIIEAGVKRMIHLAKIRLRNRLSSDPWTLEGSTWLRHLGEDDARLYMNQLVCIHFSGWFSCLGIGSFGDSVGLGKYCTPSLLWQLYTGRIRDERVRSSVTSASDCCHIPFC